MYMVVVVERWEKISLRKDVSKRKCNT